ncbi:ABC transporter substrate-binding protein [Streptomyces aurantiacus]|uniref:ABC transporter substrate-binding protein n=1 Tax=Streptomyces aurantiacus TaxID=47760 RepID=A0A7G1P7B4_9ACTN|nr:iron-siderophore ABC transporter substrate-binding protein [Streptomyces aurantiacus]BCL29726.1 ABC transporter substrate-binding protein [Streptomyces aurantiacus]
MASSPFVPSPVRRPVRRPVSRPVTATVVLAVCALALTSCGSSDPDDGTGSGSGSGTEKAGGTTTVTDVTGTKVEIPAAPERVVALSEMDLDSALALGVEPVGLTAGRGQKGAPAYLADQAKDIPVVGAVTGPDVEKVVQADPDVILAGQLADKQVLAQLRKIAPTVVTIDAAKSWKTSLELTGKALGRTNEAEKFLTGYDTKAAALKKDLGAGASVSVARYSAKGTAVMQQGVFVSDVLKDLGFERPGIQSEKGEGHSTPISEENLKEIDGDWLFIGTLDPGTSDSQLLAALGKKAAYRQLNAVRDKHATVIDGSKWTSLGGAQAAVSVLDDIRKAMVK